MSPAASKKTLQSRIDAAEKLAEAAKKEAKLAKLGFRNAKQLFKTARRSAKKRRKEVKVLKRELAALAVRKLRRPAPATPAAPKSATPSPKVALKRARLSASPVTRGAATPVATPGALGKLPATSVATPPPVPTV